MQLTGVKKFNVLHVVSRLPIGGVENMLLREVQGYNKERFNASVCCIKEGGKIADELERSGYKVEVLSKMKGHGFDWSVIRALYRIIKRDNIQILRTHQYHANLYGRFAGILANVPVIIPTFHNLYRSPNKPKLHRRFLNYLLSFFSDVLVPVSGSVASDMIKFDWANRKKVRTIYNGIVIEDYNIALSKQKARRILNLPPNCTIIGTVGRLTAQKGHRHLIEAASKLRDNCFVIAGDGHLMEELKNLSSYFKVNCIFMGSISPENIPLFLRSLDIFCFPSLWEGLPVALIEALAAGLPIVASDILPHIEVLGNAGIFSASGNIESLRAAIKALIDNPPLMEDLGKKAKERAKIFSMENTIKAYEELFENILRKKELV